MTRRLAVRVRGLIALGGGLLIGALAGGRPDLAVLAVPLLLYTAIGLAASPRPRLGAALELDRERVLESEPATATLSLVNQTERPFDVEIALSRSERLTISPDGPLLLSLAADAQVDICFVVSAERWGVHQLGPVCLRARDRFGLLVSDGQIAVRASLRAFPSEERLRQLIAPAQTQPFLGGHVARAHGDGIEFADVRAFGPDDRVRQINWRVTARRGALYVTDRHPEHASDVVLLLDTFAEARDEDAGTLDEAVRATASLARSFSRAATGSPWWISAERFSGWNQRSARASCIALSMRCWRARSCSATPGEPPRVSRDECCPRLRWSSR